MKISELTPKMPHLYLDMDGVQADFFGAWAKEHNVPTYKHISDPDNAIAQLIAQGPDKVYQFFHDLEPLRGGQIIINWLHRNRIPFTVLSAPLRGIGAGPSIKAKKDWLDKYNPGTSNDAIFTSAKYKYAVTDGTPNVLIDDFGKYIDAWHNAGGIAVKHDEATTGHTIKMLEKIYAPYLHFK